ncbi:UNVERIFIED_CONTAM: hypothetical protein FKN15_055710 [Acipenser sinensis]
MSPVPVIDEHKFHKGDHEKQKKQTQILQEWFFYTAEDPQISTVNYPVIPKF